MSFITENSVPTVFPTSNPRVSYFVCLIDRDRMLCILMILMILENLSFQ